MIYFIKTKKKSNFKYDPFINYFKIISNIIFNMGCIQSNNKKKNNNDKSQYVAKKDDEKQNIQLSVLNKQPTNKYILSENELDNINERILKDAEEQMNLQHIIESIYDAAVKAHSNVQINNLHNLFWLLPVNENGIHVPKTIPIQIPTDTDDINSKRVVNVPIITLINQQNLNISELKIKTEVDMELESVPKEDKKNCFYDITKKNYSLRLVPGDKSTTIDMTIKMDPPLEIYNRILSKLEKQI